MEKKINQTVQEAIFSAQQEYPEKFANLEPCHSQKKHSWIAVDSARPQDIRLADVYCLNCQINLAVSLHLFAGAGFH